MNSEINQINHHNQGSGAGVAFLLGAIFNVLASINFEALLEHALIAVIGGVIWLAFQVFANRILQKLKEYDQKKSEKKSKQDGNR